MAWRHSGDKPLSEPMMVGLPTHIYTSLGLNELTLKPSDTYTHVSKQQFLLKKNTFENVICNMVAI